MKKNKFINQNFYDIADELFTSIDENEIYVRKEKKEDDCFIYETEVKKDDNPYNKSKGIYTSIQYEDLDNEKTFDKVSNYLSIYLKDFFKKMTSKKKPSILIVGLGNETYSPDALGPKVIKKINATSHLPIKEVKNKVSCLIPGVMGITGLESAKIVKGVVDEHKIDIVLVVDSLATTSIKRLNKVIQITNTGINPGSGIQNYRKGINKSFLKIPVISIGVGTVISLLSIANELIGNLENKNELIYQLFEKEYNSSFMLTSKEIETKIEVISDLIALAINKALNPQLIVSK